MTDDEVLKSLSEHAGSLVEVCVLEAGIDIWRSVVSHLVEINVVCDFAVAGISQDPVVDDAIFADPEGPTYTMSVRYSGMLWTTAFLSIDTIDFQGDPREVVDRVGLDVVRQFMSELNQVTGKSVVLIPETVDQGSAKPYFSVG